MKKSLVLEDLKRSHMLSLYPRRRGDMVPFTLEEFIAHVQVISSYSRIRYAAVNELGDTIMIGGVMAGPDEEERGVGQLWMVGSEQVPEYGLRITKMVRKLMAPTLKEFNLHRLQSEVLCDKDNWRRWAKLFGMKEEGVMRKFTKDKKDCVLVAYVEGDEK